MSRSWARGVNILEGVVPPSSLDGAQLAMQEEAAGVLLACSPARKATSPNSTSPSPTPKSALRRHSKHKISPAKWQSIPGGLFPEMPPMTMSDL